MKQTLQVKVKPRNELPGLGLRVALLSPYNGGNLGDAAIQDAIIANIRLRMPGTEFSGITLNCANFIEQHGSDAFPLVATGTRFFAMEAQTAAATINLARSRSLLGRIKKKFSKMSAITRFLQRVSERAVAIPREIGHWLEGYRFLRTQDLLIVSGGGQLDERWGGPWGHPFALFKWAALARVARVPCAVVSVGVGSVTSPLSQLFLSIALRLACYRSYRDRNTREAAAVLLESAPVDPVVPDLTFSLSSSDLPGAAGLRELAQGRSVVAVGPIGYARPGSWPYQDAALYKRYLAQMAQVMAQVLERGYFLLIVWSSCDDQVVISEILGLLNDKYQRKLAEQMYMPRITTWRDLAASLRDADFLIASRLHSTILGFLTHTPTVAISFNPKVDWLMREFGQDNYLLQISDFSAADVIEALDQLSLHKLLVKEQISSYQTWLLSAFAPQYDALIDLAMARHQRRA